MVDTLNCPNCGAPIHGNICEYCQTMFIRRNVPNYDLVIQFPYRIKPINLKEKLEELERQLKYTNIGYIDSDCKVIFLKEEETK